MIKPMLAYKVDKKPVDWSEKVYIQPKLDGVRCVIYVDDKENIRCFSRTGKEFHNLEHIKLSLNEFFFDYANVDVVLDGELYNHDLRDNFEKIISLVRKQTPTLVDQHEARLLTQFHCYDMINPDFDYNFNLRDEFLQQELYNVEYIKLVPTLMVESDDQARRKHTLNLAHGYEGSIVRLNTHYQNNERKIK